MMTDIQNIRWVGFNLGPPALEASTLPIGYQGGGQMLLKCETISGKNRFMQCFHFIRSKKY